MAATSRDYYEILGVARDATAEEIHRAYRRLARRYHPDLNRGQDARTRFDELSGAYEVLHDPDQRARYDRRTGAAGASVTIRASARAHGPGPAFAPAARRDDVPRFLDEQADRRPAAPRSRPASHLVIVWDLPYRPRFGWQPAPRPWPAPSWWLR